ncbi:MAG: hypothetical protein E6L03_01840 [Thaumarchaeota archaeon]|nr:MAG: hypothetical protein E6L03_01840 [Nitrososphaerota archaeon]
MTDKILLYAAAVSTIIAGVLHLAIVPMFFKLMTIYTITFFVVSGLAQFFWFIPTIKIWIIPWYYIGIGGTIILILLWVIAVPGSGHPIGKLDLPIEVSQIVFIILCIIIIKKSRVEMKSSRVEK